MLRSTFLVAVLAGQAFAASCGNLASLKLPHTTITTAQLVTGGTFTPPGEQRPIENLPEFCRVAGAIKPSSDSNILFEVWMPVSGWNHKFQGIGNGGFAGSISYGGVGLANAVKRGYATASTDTGHSGEGAAWALGHPEKIVDYGHRAIHEMTVQAKAIIQAFYGEPPRRSYFSSCSNGGRQALMEAQRYPGDYDGIIAGAPANNFTHLLLGFVWNLQALDKAAIPASKMAALESAILAQCDARDGLKDGVLEDPRKCKFDPGKITCSASESDACLTAAQIGALKKIYSGPRASNGKFKYPGFEPGGETAPGGWDAWIIGPAGRSSAQYGFGTHFLKYMVFQDPNYDFRNFNFDRDTKTVDEKLASILNATDPNLTAFKERGGKLILFHGWCDAAIPPRNAIDYFNAVKRKMGASTESFVRLYMVSGLKHCGGGPGPNSFGAYGEGQAEMFNALVDWVEKGTAPTRIIASREQRTRPLCPYPQVARYKGTGSTDDAANFECRVP